MAETESILGESGFSIPATRRSDVLKAIVNAKRDIAERTEAVGIASAETISIVAKPEFNKPKDPVSVYRLRVSTEYTKSKGSKILWLPQVELKITVPEEPSQRVEIELLDIGEESDTEEQGEDDTDPLKGEIVFTDRAVDGLMRLLDEFGL